MKPTITNSGPKIGELELAAFEQRHNLSLPPDYRAFMLEHNGGMPRPEVLNSKHGSTLIWLLYSLENGDPFDLNIACVSLDWESAYDEGYICIGRDSCGSDILLGRV